MIKEFKEFIMKGSVLDLAIGVVIGGAFTAIVTGLVDGVITPLVNLVFVLLFNMDQDKMADGWKFTVEGVKFNVGSVVTALISFIITGFVLFMIVKGVNKAKAFGTKGEEEEAELEAATAEDYLREIRDLLEMQAGPIEQTDVDEKAESDLGE